LIEDKSDYHEYVIKDGKFVGEFEEMYQKCKNPWPETEHDLDNNPVSSYTPSIISQQGFIKIFSLGIGSGLHAAWLKKKVPEISIEGCDISETALKYCHKYHPEVRTYHMDVNAFIKKTIDFDLVILREILWYILPSWKNLMYSLAQKYEGKHILIEITCYDNQTYGREFFDGPEDIIKKFPFTLKDIVRHHVTPNQREGMILLFGKITKIDRL